MINKQQGRTMTFEDIKARRNEMLDAAIQLAELSGYTTVTRQWIADRVGCSPQLVNRYLGNLTEVRAQLLARAVETGNARVIAQGMLNNDPAMPDLDDQLKQDTLESVL